MARKSLNPLPMHCSVIAWQRTGVGLKNLLGLMGLVVDVVEVLGAIISNSSYGDRTGNCSLEIGVTLTAVETSVTPAAAHALPSLQQAARNTFTGTHPCRHRRHAADLDSSEC